MLTAIKNKNESENGTRMTDKYIVEILLFSFYLFIIIGWSQ